MAKGKRGNPQTNQMRMNLKEIDHNEKRKRWNVFRCIRNEGFGNSLSKSLTN